MKPLKRASEMRLSELAAYIDQSVLKPEFTQEDIARYIREGVDFGCKTVCVNPASLPIARCTGGLADTIEDGVSGFLFDAPRVDAYRQAIDRALHVFAHPELLEAMRCRAMRAPLYWRQSVQPYDRLFQRLLSHVSARQALR